MATALVTTLLLCALLVAAGIALARRWPRPSPGLVAALLVLSLPAVLYAGYYLHLVDEPVLLYRLRALPGSELLAALIGVPLGWLAALLARDRRRPVRLLSAGLAIAPLLILLPYAKELTNGLDQGIVRDQWRDGICLQSTASTCGPAAAATLLRSFGLPASEAELADEARTTAGGTEVWYLARALRARGLAVSFVRMPAESTTLPYPAIAGTRLGGAAGSGHFIAVLGREGGRYVVGDPMLGRELLDPAAPGEDARWFTGFFLLVERPR